MKKIFFLLLSGVLALQAAAQCTCGACSNPVGLVTPAGDNMLQLPKRRMQAELFSEWRKFSDMPVLTAEAYGTSGLTSAAIITAAIRYGVTERLMVSAIQPYAVLKGYPGSSYGLTDLTLLAGYTVIGKPFVKVSVTAGAKLPTVNSAIIEGSPVVLGSGSLDPAAGVALAVRRNRFIYTANFFYKHAAVGKDGISFGDLVTHNITVAYKSAGDTIADTGRMLNFALGLSGEWNAPQTRSHLIIVPGGYTAFLSPAVIFRTNRWSIPASFELPVLKTKSNYQTTAYRVKLGIIYSFNLKPAEK